MRVIKLFIRDNKRYLLNYIFTWIFSMMSIVISILLPLTMQCIIDYGILNQDKTKLLFYIFLALILELFENILLFIVNIRYGDLRRKYVYDTKARLMSKLKQFSGQESVELDSARFMNIIEQDVEEVANGFTETIYLLISDIISASVSLLILLNINPPIFGFIFVVQIFLFLLNKRLGSKVKQLTIEQRSKIDKQKSELQDEILNLEYLLQTDIIGYFTKKFMKSENIIVDLRYRMDRYMAVNISSTSCLRGLSSLIIWGIGGMAVIGSKITLGEVYSINSYTNRFFSPLLRIADTNIAMKSIGVSLSRIYSILEIKEPGDAGNLCEGIQQGEIAFDQVSFSYGMKGVLDKCSFKILPNQINMITGKSGVGKTTITKLICGLWQAKEGKIYIDHIDIKEFSTEYLRRNISIISQKNEIFNGTIYDNIVMDLDIDEEEVFKVCHMLGIYEEILSFEKGFCTTIGIEGKNISGGQIQRIAIARALLKHSKIMIFDEPTSNLDVNNKNNIMDILLNIKDCTVIIISHDTDLINSGFHRINISDGKARSEI